MYYEVNRLWVVFLFWTLSSTTTAVKTENLEWQRKIHYDAGFLFGAKKAGDSITCGINKIELDSAGHDSGYAPRSADVGLEPWRLSSVAAPRVLKYLAYAGTARLCCAKTAVPAEPQGYPASSRAYGLLFFTALNLIEYSIEQQ